jgi:hypothetical protein
MLANETGKEAYASNYYKIIDKLVNQSDSLTDIHLFMSYPLNK